MLPVVIIAGGLATRLYPETLRLPKSLIEINGTPFIDHQLRLLKEKGVERVILCIGHFSEMIEEYVGNGSQYGLDVKYSYDGDELLGTGGAVKKASIQLPDAFIIMYGDSYLDVDLDPIIRDFFEKGLSVLMTVYQNNNKFDRSNIVMKNGRIIMYSKKETCPGMEYIDYGLIVIRKDVFSRYPTGKAFDLSQILSDEVTMQEVAAYEVSQRFYEIGSPKGIRETAEYIRNRE